MRFNEAGDNFMINGQSTNRHYTTPYDKNISNTIGANITKVKDQFEISGNVSFSMIGLEMNQVLIVNNT